MHPLSVLFVFLFFFCLLGNNATSCIFTISLMAEKMYRHKVQTLFIFNLQNRHMYWFMVFKLWIANVCWPGGRGCPGVFGIPPPYPLHAKKEAKKCLKRDADMIIIEKWHAHTGVTNSPLWCVWRSKITGQHTIGGGGWRRNVRVNASIIRPGIFLSQSKLNLNISDLPRNYRIRDITLAAFPHIIHIQQSFVLLKVFTLVTALDLQYTCIAAGWEENTGGVDSVQILRNLFAIQQATGDADCAIHHAFWMKLHSRYFLLFEVERLSRRTRDVNLSIKEGGPSQGTSACSVFRHLKKNLPVVRCVESGNRIWVGVLSKLSVSCDCAGCWW